MRRARREKGEGRKTRKEQGGAERELRE